MPSRNSVWLNADGLKVGFGPRHTDNTQAGPYKTEGLFKQIEKRIYGVDVPATDTTAVQGDEVPIPADAVGLRAYVQVTDAFASAGGDATLSIGVKQKDGTTIDVDGIDAAIAEADLSAGAVITADGDLINASVGDDDAYITFTYGTEAFTAGEAVLIVEYALQPSTVSEVGDKVDSIISDE